MMIEGASKMDPAMMHAVTVFMRGPLNPITNAVTKHTIATAHNK
jgi:hypothetical protein